MKLRPGSYRLRHFKSTLLAGVLVSCLAACTHAQTQAFVPVIVPHRIPLDSISVKALNYTPWYIHEFEIEGPEGLGIHGGGPNIWPAEEDGQPSGGGAETCCLTYPSTWRPDLKLTVRWLAYKDVKKLGAKAPGYWYKADNVRIAQYGETNYSAWMIFLPGDRVRLMITDGNEGGGNNPNNRPADDDPLIVKGVLDDEWNERFPNGVARGIK